MYKYRVGGYGPIYYRSTMKAVYRLSILYAAQMFVDVHGIVVSIFTATSLDFLPYFYTESDFVAVVHVLYKQPDCCIVLML